MHLWGWWLRGRGGRGEMALKKKEWGRSRDIPQKSSFWTQIFTPNICCFVAKPALSQITHLNCLRFSVWDFFWTFLLKFLSGIFAWDFRLRFLSETFVWNFRLKFTSETFIWDFRLRFSSEFFVVEIFVWDFHRNYLSEIFIWVFVWDFCLRLLSEIVCLRLLSEIFDWRIKLVLCNCANIIL